MGSWHVGQPMAPVSGIQGQRDRQAAGHGHAHRVRLHIRAMTRSRAPGLMAFHAPGAVRPTRLAEPPAPSRESRWHAPQGPDSEGLRPSALTVSGELRRRSWGEPMTVFSL